MSKCSRIRRRTSAPSVTSASGSFQNRWIRSAIAQASRSDKLAHTVGYDQVVEVASRAFCVRRYRLIEAAAGAVADAILDGFTQVTAVRVTLHKPHAPIAATFADVGVTLRRSRDERGHG